MNDSIEAREFEQHLRDGIAALKNGDRSLAIRLFDQAAMMNGADARVWVWLSATTDDLQERRAYLEKAIAIDPSNATAKRGLMLLTDQLDKTRLMPEGEAFTHEETPSPEGEAFTHEESPSPEGEAFTHEDTTPPDGEAFTHEESPSQEEAVVKTYVCPNCGARISFDIHETTLVCQFCGFTHRVEERDASVNADQVLDIVLPTTPAHRWAEKQARVSCEQCGVIILLPPGQTADTCPYCASNRIISSPSLMELIDPQVIGLFKIDAEQAGRSIKKWLGKGLLSPDNLVSNHSGMLLHPAYYPFWLFEGTLEIPWFCDVNVGSGKAAVWEAHTGSQFEMFEDILIPGLRKISRQDLMGIEPFVLNDLVDFSPDYLAGWVALTYDLPLADASLQARELVIRKVRSSLPGFIEPTRSKRNFSIGAGKWSGLTYKLALLPIYIGNYPFQGKRYRLLVNGQTGKVNGDKPVDHLKTTMMVITGVILLAILLLILWSAWRWFTG